MVVDVAGARRPLLKDVVAVLRPAELLWVQVSAGVRGESDRKGSRSSSLLTDASPRTT